MYEAQRARGNFGRNFPALPPCYHSLARLFREKFYISITISTFRSRLSLFRPAVLASVPPVYRLFSSLPTSSSLERYALVFLPLCSDSLGHLDVHGPPLSSIGTLVLPFVRDILARFISWFNPCYSPIIIFGPGFLLLPIDYSYGSTHSLSSRLRVFVPALCRLLCQFHPSSAASTLLRVHNKVSYVRFPFVLRSWPSWV